MLSCKAMMCTISNPPKHFDDFVLEHFCKCKEGTIAFCISWVNQAASVGGHTNETATSSSNKEMESRVARLSRYLSFLEKNGRFPTEQEEVFIKFACVWLDQTVPYTFFSETCFLSAITN